LQARVPLATGFFAIYIFFKPTLRSLMWEL
jgi:uncharacterized MAPEG superfamily protein